MNAELPAETMSRASATADALRMLPYSFARSGQILIVNQHPDTLEVWVSERRRLLKWRVISAG